MQIIIEPDEVNKDKLSKVYIYDDGIVVEITLPIWEEYVLSEICEQIISFYNQMVGG